MTDRLRLAPHDAIQLVGYLVIAAVLFWWTTRPFPIFASSRIILLAFLIFAALWSFLANRASRNSLVVASLLVVGVLVGTLASLAWRTSLESALIPLVAVTLFLLLANLGLDRGWLVIALVGAASMLALVAVIDFAEEVILWNRVISDVAPSSSFWEKMPVTLPRVGVGGLHSNETAVVAALSIPMALVGRRRFSEFRFFWTLAVGVLVLMVLVTGSRGGAVAALIAGLLTLWMLRGGGSRSERRWMVAGVVGALLLLGGAAVIVLTDYRPAFIFRGTVAGRLPLWGAGWEMFKDSPVVGNGMGSFSWLVHEYLGSTYPGVEARRIWTEAHNGYVQLLAEAGIVGFGAVAATAWLIVRRAKLLMRDDVFTKEYAIATLAGLTGLAFHSIFDVLTPGLAPMIFAAALVGGLYTGPRRYGREVRWLSRSWTLALVGPLIVFASLTIGPHLTYERGVAASYAGNWSTAAEHFNRAAVADPLPLYERAASVAEAMAGSPDAARLREASQLEPFDSAAFINWIRVSGLDTTGDVPDRLLRAEEVIDIATGEVFDDAGRNDAALDSYVAALVTNPWLVESEVWSKVFTDSGAKLDLYRRAIERNPCGVGDVFYAMGVDLSPFREVIQSTCAPKDPTNLALRLAEGGREEVFRIAVDGIRSVPEDVRLRRLAGLSLAEPDPEDSRRHLAVAGLLGDPWSALALADTYEEEDMPGSLTDLLERNLLGYSPVIELHSGIGTYRFGAIRTHIVDRRPGTPSTLLDGEWMEAQTRLHERIINRMAADS